MNTNKFLNGLGFSSALVGAALLSTSAFAGENHSELNSWVSGAASAIDEVMTYPAMAQRHGDSGVASFEVTIDRAGNVVEQHRTKSAGGLLNGAAKRSLDKADFPALPADFDGDTLTFALNLEYQVAGSAAEERQLRNKTKVTREQIAAGASKGRYASIQIISSGFGDK